MPEVDKFTLEIKYIPPQLMSDDPLKLLKFIASDFFQLKIVRQISFVLFLLHCGLQLITTYCFVYVFNQKEVINYFSVYCCLFYPIIALHTLLFDPHMIDNLPEVLPLWNLDCTGRKMRDNFVKETKSINLFAVLTLLFTILTSFLYVQNFSVDIKIFFALRLFQDYFPNQAYILCKMYKLTYPFLGYVMTAHCLQLLYCVEHYIIQCKIFQTYLSGITEIRTDLKEEDWFYCEEYQNDILKRLKFCTKRGIELLDGYAIKNADIKYKIVRFSICGCILGIGIAFYILSDLILPEYYLRLAMTSLAASLVFAGIIWSGQAFESESLDIPSTLCQIRWYNFNKDNKQIYLIFLLNTMKERKITFSEHYSINYELGLAIVRNIYSVLSVLVNMYSSK